MRIPGAINICCKLFKIFLYVQFGWFCLLYDVWGRFIETDFTCEHPASLPVNSSGIRVLIAGVAKTGTRSMTSALYNIGFGHSYHSEDFGMLLWGPLADRYWLKKGGGSWSNIPIPASQDDLAVLSDLGSEGLAEAYSKCKVDALALDGIEKLVFATYPVSPGAKVVMLNWRTFDEWQTSQKIFERNQGVEVLFTLCVYMGRFILPWGALFHPVDKFIRGGAMEQRLKSGGPPFTQVYDFHSAIFLDGTAARRAVPRHFSGLSQTPKTQEEYDDFYQRVKEMVPPEDLFEWDMRKHTYEDLCEFVGVDDCPKTGLLERQPNYFVQFQLFPWVAFQGTIAAMLMHWANWKILGFLLSPIYRRLCRRRAKAE